MVFDNVVSSGSQVTRRNLHSITREMVSPHSLSKGFDSVFKIR